MKKMSLIIKCLLPVFIIFFHTVSAFGEEEEPEIRVTIRGILSNTAEVGAHINSLTSLKLYPCEITDKMDVQITKGGEIVLTPGQAKQAFCKDDFNRIYPTSSLSRILLPDFDRFKFFRARGLEPGRCYKICIMMMDLSYPGMVPLETEDGKAFEFVIPEPGEGENSHSIVVDLTKTPLFIPKPPKR